MPGMFIAGIISTVLSLGIWGALIIKKTPASLHSTLILAFLVQLPMSALVFYFVREPISNWYATIFEPGTPWYTLIKSFEAPLTEEPAKLISLLFIPFVLKFLKGKQAWFLGLAIGLGFGIGEIWTLVYLLYEPSLANVPWYNFIGGMIERILACFAHGVFTGIAVVWILRAKRLSLAIKGLLLAMLGHYMLNVIVLLPYMIPQIMLIPYTVWMAIVGVYLGIFFITIFIFFWKRAIGKAPNLAWALGITTCKSCGRKFKAGLLTINLAVATGQRCPYCKKWHIYKFRPFKKRK